MTMAVYTIRCIKNGKVYVGSSVHAEKRWSQHKNLLLSGKHHSWKLQEAWNRHGDVNFVFELQVEVDRVRHLRNLESDYIERFNAINEGFNVSSDTDCIFDNIHRDTKKARRIRMYLECYDDNAIILFDVLRKYHANDDTFPIQDALIELYGGDEYCFDKAKESLINLYIIDKVRKFKTRRSSIYRWDDPELDSSFMEEEWLMKNNKDAFDLYILIYRINRHWDEIARFTISEDVRKELDWDIDSLKKETQFLVKYGFIKVCSDETEDNEAFYEFERPVTSSYYMAAIPNNIRKLFY